MEQHAPDVNSSADDFKNIFALIDTYFQSIYSGDAVPLHSVFHPRCRLFADVDGTPYEKSVEEYVQGVSNRKSPRDLGEPFQMQILGIQILGALAMVRTRQRMLGFNYHDYLTLLRRDARWLIVNKSFVNLAATPFS